MNKTITFGIVGAIIGSILFSGAIAGFPVLASIAGFPTIQINPGNSNGWAGQYGPNAQLVTGSGFTANIALRVYTFSLPNGPIANGTTCSPPAGALSGYQYNLCVWSIGGFTNASGYLTDYLNRGGIAGGNLSKQGAHQVGAGIAVYGGNYFCNYGGNTGVNYTYPACARPYIFVTAGGGFRSANYSAYPPYGIVNPNGVITTVTTSISPNDCRYCQYGTYFNANVSTQWSCWATPTGSGQGATCIWTGVSTSSTSSTSTFTTTSTSTTSTTSSTTFSSTTVLPGQTTFSTIPTTSTSTSTTTSSTTISPTTTISGGGGGGKANYLNIGVLVGLIIGALLGYYIDEKA